MKFVKRALKILVYLFIILLIGGCFFIRFIANRSVPDYNKKIELKGLNEEVKVSRDSFAIPHIYANNEEDLYRAVGYLMAQDRLWQMDLLRRVTQGRLSEIFGEDMVDADLFLRALRIPEKSVFLMEIASPEILSAFEAYTDGINQYIEQHIHKLPPEFAILGYNPERWEARHSFNVLGYMAWDLSKGAYSSEITLYKIIKKLGLEKTMSLIPNIAGRKEVVYPGFNMDSTLLDQEANLIRGADLVDDLGVKAFEGSNNWAISGEKSTTGKPLMANDMHLGLNNPGIWYQIHEVIEGGLNVTGVAVPGQPFVIAGHNEDIAWGLTNLYVDDIDLYHEKLNPDNPHEYWFNGEWHSLEIRKEVINIKGGESVEFENRFTHRGPIISGFKNMDEAISMKWIGNEYSNEMRSVYLLNRAENWEDFKDALTTFNSISQNFVYADVNGNIGLYAGGGVPIRKGENYLIKPGQTDEFDWKGRVPFDELPHSYNPESGMVSSANNKTVGNEYPYYIGSYYSQGYRISRIREMLKAKEKLSIDDFVSMQADFKSEMAIKFIPDILTALEEQDFNDMEQKGYDIMVNWNDDMDASKSAPLIFEELYHIIIKNLIEDELGNLFSEYYENSSLSRNFMENFWDEKDPTWCDNVSTNDHVEDFEDIVTQSFKESMATLSLNYGSDPEAWEWGNAHKLVLEHPMGKVKILDRIFKLNRGPYPTGGSFHTVNPFSYSFADRYTANFGASHRHIYSTADWNESITVIPTGESGIPASKHYCDQTDLYLENKYHSDPFTINEVEKKSMYKTVLVESK